MTSELVPNPLLLNISQLRTEFNVSSQRLARMLSISPRELRALEQGETGGLQHDASLPARLRVLRQIYELASTVYEPEGVARFLTTPLDAFDGLTASELLERGEPERVLVALIEDYEAAGC